MLRRHLGVKYLQRMVLGSLVESASNPQLPKTTEALHPELTTFANLSWNPGTYQYDAAGNVTAIGNNYSYQYDSL